MVPLKVSAHPYLFELFLSGEVEEESSKCQITDDQIIFELKKIDRGPWSQIAVDLDNDAKIEKRKEITASKHEELAQEASTRKERLRNLQQISVQEQIELDSRNRATVEEIKTQEKEKAMNEFEEWKKKKVEEPSSG